MNIPNVINAAVSVLTLIGLTLDVTKNLTNILKRYDGARLRLNSLLLQILALRTALHQIDGLVKAGAAEKHHQLTMDMGTCLTCCEPLLEKLDKDCKRLAKDDGPLIEPTFLVRLETAFNGGPATDMEALLDRQTNALNLLLTAYSW